MYNLRLLEGSGGVVKEVAYLFFYSSLAYAYIIPYFY
jgi:hypothetical protein